MINTAAYIARSRALDEGAKREAAYRTTVNVLAIVAVAGIFALEWSALLTGRAFLLAFGGWLVVRVIGIGVVNAWAKAYIERIKVEHPIDYAGLSAQQASTDTKGATDK